MPDAHTKTRKRKEIHRALPDVSTPAPEINSTKSPCILLMAMAASYTRRLGQRTAARRDSISVPDVEFDAGPYSYGSHVTITCSHAATYGGVTYTATTSFSGTWIYL